MHNPLLTTDCSLLATYNLLRRPAPPPPQAAHFQRHVSAKYERYDGPHAMLYQPPAGAPSQAPSSPQIPIKESSARSVAQSEPPISLPDAVRPRPYAAEAMGYAAPPAMEPHSGGRADYLGSGSSKLSGSSRRHSTLSEAGGVRGRSESELLHARLDEQVAKLCTALYPPLLCTPPLYSTSALHLCTPPLHSTSALQHALLLATRARAADLDDRAQRAMALNQRLIIGTLSTV